MVTYKVGSNIDAWCTKCKFLLAHTIEAIADGAIKRVQCNTCRGRHRFLSAKPGDKARVRAMGEKREKKSAISPFASLVANKDLSKAMSYHIGHRFHKGDVIDHNSFGVGVVIEERDQNKIEALFECGIKILVHGRSSSQ